MGYLWPTQRPKSSLMKNYSYFAKDFKFEPNWGWGNEDDPTVFDCISERRIKACEAGEPVPN